MYMDLCIIGGPISHLMIVRVFVLHSITIIAHQTYQPLVIVQGQVMK